MVLWAIRVFSDGEMPDKAHARLELYREISYILCNRLQKNIHNGIAHVRLKSVCSATL